MAIDLSIDGGFGERDIIVTLGVMTFSVVAPIGQGSAQASLEAVAAALYPCLQEEKPAALPAIAATRQAYRALGKDPGRYRPSSEALMRRVASGKPLPQINNVVDAGNLLSLETHLSLGAYNAGKIEGPVTFRRAGDGETADAIGRGVMNFEHLPVFADERGPFGSPTSDTERTMVTPEATDILMVLIAFHRDDAMDANLARGQALLTEHAAAHGFETAVITNW